MGRIPGWLLVHTITVEAYKGESSKGPLYGPPTQVRCFLDEQTRAVRSPGGETVTSTSTAYTAPGVAAPPLSRVTTASGRITTVIQDKRRDGRGLRTPDHMEIQLE
ncbi:hypothetical protein [Streptomyces sp. NPDC056512]|uniref:hypothetical protein n=1 Tax=Streptomyces sp. NPDC056512 TaxID=3345846 RepID=UPI00367E8A3B